MNFITYAIMICVINSGQDICYGPYPSKAYFMHEPFDVDARGLPNVRSECVKHGAATVRAMDKALKPYGLEAFIFQSRKGCGMPPEGSSEVPSLHRGLGA